MRECTDSHPQVNTPYKVLIFGSRTWPYNDRAQIVDVIVAAMERVGHARLVLIHGDCGKGADAIVRDLCDLNGFAQIAMPAAWLHYKRAAGPIRNQWMLDFNPDIAEAHGFRMPGKSSGTDDMHRRAVAAGVPVTLHAPEARRG